MQIFVDDSKPVWMADQDVDLIDEDKQPEPHMAYNSDGYPIDSELESMQKTVNGMLPNLNYSRQLSHKVRALKKPVDSPFYPGETFQYRNTHSDNEDLLSNERSSMLTSLSDRVTGIIGHDEWERTDETTRGT